MTTASRQPASVPLLPGEDPNVVYPEEEKVPESELQGNARRYVQGALSIRYQDQPGVYVAGDLFVFYRMNDAEARLAPDIMVVFGAAESPPRPSWRVWREGGLTPDFVLEIAAEGTVADDAGWKRDRYAAMAVSEYWRFDPQGGELIAELLVGEVLRDGSIPAVAGGPGRRWHIAGPQRVAGAGSVRGGQRTAAV